VAAKRGAIGSRAVRPLAGRQFGPRGGRAVRPLAGRPVMITGAASGIGRSLARRLSGLGSPAAIADIDEAGLKETARTLPGPVLVRVLDVRDAADQRRFAAEVREWLPSMPGAPPLAAVFNNAGEARILVGPDAYVFDALARVAPTHYYDVMAVLEKRLRAGAR
jgi:NAD(P)-dependent dehydrogenase (short-subunit alcohol dehydrogenase family)